MLIQIGDLRLNVSTPVLVAIAAGVAVVLIILIICCCCCCYRRRNRRNEVGGRRFQVENPPVVKGNQNGRPVQQMQQQNNPPRMAENRMVPNNSPPTPPAAAAAAITAPRQSPRQPPRRPPTALPPYINKSARNSTSSNSSASSLSSAQTVFSYEELVIATNGFSKGNIVGEGGFGFVHKGILPNGKEIAVKSLKCDSRQGEREFQAEVQTVSRIHHRHLVSLVGYCSTGSQRLLVYELVRNKTLLFHLHGEGNPPLDWQTRIKAAIGAAKGLAYLHEDCQPRIIHRDIKAANILLDDSFEAKVADFGLAKFYSLLETHVSTRVMGTIGYMAPEYASSGKLTVKSDVYSFGVLLLELITGHKPLYKTAEATCLVDWARPLLTAAIESENYNYLVDPQIQYCFNHTEMTRMVHVAATCVRKSARRRPKMSMVVRALEGNISLDELRVGIMRDLSSANVDDTSSEYSGSYSIGTSIDYGSTTEKSGKKYKRRTSRVKSTGDSAREQDITEEHDGTTSEFGLYASSSSDEETTQELNSAEIKRVIRHSQRPPV
ncbi:proline-rich receptor-like protein kinase PERK15 [Silene latifolia]|uniref:proline-rich receptor-like protein kinase PERK15 n=1 Tax=Silene latifolia TaxID=37657 RepID=UPI003D789749